MQSYEEGIVSKESKGFEPIEKATVAIQLYCGKAWDSDYHESKNDRIKEYSPNIGDIYELIIAIWTVALMNETSTLQSVMGRVAGKINCTDPLDRAKIAAECIALCAHADVINVDFVGSTYQVSTRWQLDTDITGADKHVILTKKPRVKTTNQILGCRYKQHNKETCLDHINAMNSIKLCLNLDLLRTMEEQATFTIDTTQKADQWKLFINESYKKYLELARGGNEFYLEHWYDTRGRGYCDGYYIDYQGSSFKKAIVQLANKEVTKLHGPFER